MTVLDNLIERIAYQRSFWDEEPSAIRVLLSARMFSGDGKVEERAEVPLILCKDCKHYNDGMVNGQHRHEPYCEEVGELAFGAFYEVYEEDFCSRAERRTV